MIVVGGGHNGLVCAAYLARAGLRVTVIEAREVLGGPAASIEFLPGFRAPFTNSPGSFEESIVRDLELELHGLRFIRPDPTLLHPMDDGSTFVAWRDQGKVAAQMEKWAKGESLRYRALVDDLEHLAEAMQVSIFEASPTLEEVEHRVARSSAAALFDRVIRGSLSDLLDDYLTSPYSKALLMMLALNGQLVAPDTPGSAFGLMMRPIALATKRRARLAEGSAGAVLRGSVGLPVGTMGAMMDALVSSCRSAGVRFVTGVSVDSILHRDGRVTGVVSSCGREYPCETVVSAVSPLTLTQHLLSDVMPSNLEVAPIVRGSAFKMVVALGGLPAVSGLPADLSTERALECQFRIGPSAEYVERAVRDGLAGKVSDEPIMWGLIPSLTSPGIAPTAKHLLSVNVWHAPYDLPQGWDVVTREAFGARCLAVLERHFPGLSSVTEDVAFLDPIQIESELHLPFSNITHSDMLPVQMFGSRPTSAWSRYRGPLEGLFLTGSGTWPGGYVTGLPGRNASTAVLRSKDRLTKERHGVSS